MARASEAAPVGSGHRQGIVSARPRAASEREARHGTRPLGLGGERDGILHLPTAEPERRLPLLVMLHGAGATAMDVWPMVEEAAERHGLAVIVPESRGRSWDVIGRGYGPDVAFIDAALATVFAAAAIDPGRMALAGCSDGASYALSLGLTNGAMFSDILAFSPGFAAPARTEDAPRIFVSHGREDPILPIDHCGRRARRRRLRPRIPRVQRRPRRPDRDGGSRFAPLPDSALEMPALRPGPAEPSGRTARCRAGRSRQRARERRRGSRREAES